MSVWTEVEGVAYLHKSRLFSVKELINKHFEQYEARPCVSQESVSEDYIKVEFGFNYSESREDAWKIWSKFKSEFKELSGKSSYYGCVLDASLTIRDVA